MLQLQLGTNGEKLNNDEAGGFTDEEITSFLDEIPSEKLVAPLSQSKVWKSGDVFPWSEEQEAAFRKKCFETGNPPTKDQVLHKGPLLIGETRAAEFVPYNLSTLSPSIIKAKMKFSVPGLGSPVLEAEFIVDSGCDVTVIPLAVAKYLAENAPDNMKRVFLGNEEEFRTSS